MLTQCFQSRFSTGSGVPPIQHLILSQRSRDSLKKGNRLNVTENQSAFGVSHGSALNTYKMSHACVTAGQHKAIFDILTDDVLLEVFDCYRQTSMGQWNGTWKWTTLVHVCRRWRNIIFGSPRRLDLWLLCTYGTPVRRRLDIWPTWPIVIKYWANLEFKPPSPEDEDNLIAALEHPDRVREIQLSLTSSLLEKVAERMLVRFPALTSLSLWLDRGTGTPRTFPAAFLAGCASRLRDISLVGISFPRLPEFLASATDLVSLRLLEVPGAGHIFPDVIATCLSKLPHLRILSIEFHSPPSCRYNQEHRRPRILTRDTLPSLTRFDFRGTSEYLEDFVTRIDAPFLSQVDITFFNQLIFDIPQLSRFIGQMKGLRSAKVAEVESSPGNGVSIAIPLDSDQPYSFTPSYLGQILSFRITCTYLDWQISSMAQICRQVISFLSNVEHLDIRADFIRKENDMESIAWLDFFHSFPSVEMLRISGELGPLIAPALDGVDKEMIRDVLPELRKLLFECSRNSAPVEHFVAARELSNRPVDVQHALFPCVWDYSYT